MPLPKTIKLDISIDKWKVTAARHGEELSLGVSDRLTPVEAFKLEKAMKRAPNKKKKYKKHGHKSAARVSPKDQNGLRA